MDKYSWFKCLCCSEREMARFISELRYVGLTLEDYEDEIQCNSPPDWSWLGSKNVRVQNSRTG